MEQTRVQEEKEEETQITQTIEEETLPKSKGWMTTHLVQYQNVWLSSGALRGVSMAHRHFHACPSDIISVTSPKAGTTWFKAILFALMNRTIHPNPLLTKGPHDCVPFIETILDKNALLDLPSPRLLATHIPYSLLPVSVKSSAAKIVYICRNPKDLLVSQWNYFIKIRDKNLPPLPLAEAFELFCKGQTHFGPYWDHVLGYWNESLRSPEKVLFLKYEDMKDRPVVEVKRVARFVGRPFSPEEEEFGRVEELVELCSFEHLSNLEVNKSGVQRFSSQFAIGNHNFFRKGVVGDWRNHLTEAMGEELDRITREKFVQNFEEEGSVKLNRVSLTYVSESSERFYGFGEQFSHMDFKGKRVPIFVQEQGIGRGDQPVTLAANLVSYRAGGDWSTTYAPSPFYMTSNMRSLYLEGYNYSVFDLTKDDRVQIQIHGDSVQGRILHGNSPSELIENFTGTIGRPPELPDWIISGAVVGLQGGTETVRRVWDELRRYDVPLSAFWLQDWVGQRETFVGSQLWWNWEVDTIRYPGWKKLVKDLRAQNINVMTYCNPCLAPADEKENRRRNLFEEARDLDILVKDKLGKPYMVPNTAFDVAMLDFTHPNTATWFKQILQEMVDDGVRGWMADFGEGLPVDAILYSGEDPIEAHNRYPELWARINREFVEEWRSNHLSKEAENGEEDALVFFMRAGFRDSPKWGMLFWEGDQMVSWQANDGIKSAVTGLLSSGLSGYAFNHSDIGGYCAINIPIIKYRRSQELLLRWMELNAFSTVFRTHEGNKPSCNTQFYSNHQTLSHFARFAKVYKAWKFYRVQLVKEAAEKGLPVCRHLFIHYPNDRHVQSLSYHQFLVGSEILVVPVLDKSKKSVKAYFPSGEKCCTWQHIWTGDLYAKQGVEACVEAPIGYPAVFVKTGSYVGQTFLKNLRDSEIL